MHFFSETIFSKGLKCLQVIYESFDCDLTQGLVYIYIYIYLYIYIYIYVCVCVCDFFIIIERNICVEAGI